MQVRHGKRSKKGSTGKERGTKKLKMQGTEEEEAEGEIIGKRTTEGGDSEGRTSSKEKCQPADFCCDPQVAKG